ncbi:hypothetical protein C8Q78DRAFT_1083304 [Trametes maxima]|nr:hypothetical protein C8Q78DRAFT_1083304 [Trametes maxima]
MSTTPRPRRSNANLHPAAILLQDKQTRRSSAEVAKEKAELEARRKAIIDQRAANLQELALLEEKLKQQDVNLTASVSTPTATLRRSGQAASGLTYAAVAGGRGSVTDGLPPVATDVSPAKKAQASQSEKQKAASGKPKRASRTDVDAYRVATRPPSESVMSNDQNLVPPTMPVASRQAQKRKIGSKEKGLEERLTKKGKMTKPSGVTPTAAVKFALPSTARAKTELSTATTQPAQGLKTSSIINTVIVKHDPETLTEDKGVTHIQDTTTAPAPVTVEFGGYISDGEEVVEVSPASADIIPMGPSGTMKIEVMDVAVSPPTHVLSGLSDPTTTNLPGPVPAVLFNPATNAHDPAAAAAQLVAPRNGSHWAMAHVEKLLGPYSGNFTMVFIPRLIDLVGNHANGPWRLYGLDLVGAMKDLAQSIWPTLSNIEIIPRRPFYEVAKQKLSEYRNGMANEAIEVVTAYLQSKRFSTNDDRAEFVAWALSSEQDYPFRYACTTSSAGDQMVMIGIYRSKLIGRTFAYHLRRIGLRADQMRDWPCNALALATTAVERALKMWQTGSFQRPKPRSEEVKFSDRLWGKAANEYLGGIVNLEERQWDAILAFAETCMLTLEEDSSDDDDENDSDNSAPDLPMNGGRAAINDAEQEAYEFEMRAHPEA